MSKDSAPAKAPAQLATIRTLVKGVEVRGFTFGAGIVVDQVSMPMAEKLEKEGQVKIINITEAP